MLLFFSISSSLFNNLFWESWNKIKISEINISIISAIFSGMSFVIFITNLFNNSMNSLKIFSPNNFLYLSKIILIISIVFFAMIFLFSFPKTGKIYIISFINKISLPI